MASPDPKESAALELSSFGELASGSSRYEILQEAGRGGMGVVYRARHKSAIKLLQVGCRSDRFVREAKLLAKLQCPYVVRVHDFDTLPDGTPMLVMEWIDGQDLRRTIEAHGGRIPEPQAMVWMRQVCEGMLAAENEGIVHRDLKPSNILIDCQKRARVADFGLARSQATQTTSLTGALGV